MANIFTPTSINISGPWNIAREDCIGDSLGFINANTNYLAYTINALSANNTTLINSLSSQTTSTGAVLQIISTTQVPPNITAGATIASTGLTPITITRKRNNSRLLYELTGGRWAVTSTALGHNTWIYVSENSGTYTHHNGSPATTANSQQFIYTSSAGVQGSHCIRAFYTPGNAVSTVSFLPYIQRFSTANSTWNVGDVSAIVPIIMTVTEIA